MFWANTGVQQLSFIAFFRPLFVLWVALTGVWAFLRTDFAETSS